MNINVESSSSSIGSSNSAVSRNSTIFAACINEVMLSAVCEFL